MKRVRWCFFLLFFNVACIFIPRAEAAELIAVEDAHEKVMTAQALLVCAYDSNEAFNKMRLQNAMALSEFKEKLASVDLSKMIIFYCA
ncbi:MAG: hypothetical protein R6V46_13685 [Desulfatiglandaceae bacterium]